MQSVNLRFGIPETLNSVFIEICVTLKISTKTKKWSRRLLDAAPGTTAETLSLTHSLFLLSVLVH